MTRIKVYLGNNKTKLYLIRKYTAEVVKRLNYEIERGIIKDFEII